MSYVVEALFWRYFKVLQPIKLILNIPEIIGSYSRYTKLKYYKIEVLSSIRLISAGSPKTRDDIKHVTF